VQIYKYFLIVHFFIEIILKKNLIPQKKHTLSHQFKTHSINLQFTDILTFKNLNTQTHYELLNQDKERVETIEYVYNEIMKMKEKGLNHKEIGLELGISEPTVGRKLSRYRKLKALEESNNK
jgi:Fic family protein